MSKQKSLTLVILAAGMGSRFGGLKQIEPVGTNKESIIDFTIYDAIKAGFNRLILIIKREHESLFETNLVHKIRPFIKVEYAYQDINYLTDHVLNPERVKPWGTTHALLSCKDLIDGPFMICNADDYYGPQAFITMANFLSTQVKPFQYAMMGYRLKNTTTEHGTVTRGVCTSKKEYLTQVDEIKDIRRTSSGHEFQKDNEWYPIADDALVSMNFWGFDESVMSLAYDVFDAFLSTTALSDPLKAEHVLPTMISQCLELDACKVKVLSTEDSWYGITYQEDREMVMEALKSLKEQGQYPFDLWSKT
jgi:NDP-sugar pyrophosphorylase family protein